MVALRPIAAEDAGPLAHLLRAERAFLAPFEPERPESFYTPEGQRDRIEDLLLRRELGAGYLFGIERDVDLVGTLSVGTSSVGRSGARISATGSHSSGRGKASRRQPSTTPSHAPSATSACTGSRLGRSSTTSRRSACSRSTGSSGSAWRGTTCASPAPGATTSSTSEPRTDPRRFGRGAPRPRSVPKRFRKCDRLPRPRREGLTLTTGPSGPGECAESVAQMDEWRADGPRTGRRARNRLAESVTGARAGEDPARPSAGSRRRSGVRRAVRSSPRDRGPRGGRAARARRALPR